MKNRLLNKLIVVFGCLSLVACQSKDNSTKNEAEKEILTGDLSNEELVEKTITQNAMPGNSSTYDDQVENAKADYLIDYEYIIKESQNLLDSKTNLSDENRKKLREMKRATEEELNRVKTIPVEDWEEYDNEFENIINENKEFLTRIRLSRN